MVKASIKRLLALEDETIIHECRRCGTAVPSPDATCSECGSERISTYTI